MTRSPQSVRKKKEPCFPRNPCLTIFSLTKSYEANINISNWAVRMRRNMDPG